MSDLLRHFLTAMGLESPAAPAQVPAPVPQPFTNRSTTVFSGEAAEWVAHLRTPWEERADLEFAAEIHIERAAARIVFRALNPRSAVWAEALTNAFGDIRSRLEKCPPASRVFRELLFGNPSNPETGITLASCAGLPALATREMRMDEALVPATTRILVRTAMFEEFEPRRGDGQKPIERLGKIWEPVRHILLQLGHRSCPRDRFTERIHLTTCLALLNLHLLYEGKKDGCLVPNAAGESFETMAAARQKIGRKELFVRDPFFRMLTDVSFLLRERNIESLWNTAAVIVRDYLDGRYLRLSIAGLMPAKPAWQESMSVEWKSPQKARVARPVTGRYGIIDDEDTDAWNKVRGPLEDIGYLIVGQLGMGQFGRVYEALNLANSSIPQRVAIKVDRIRKGHKKEAIEAADTIMGIAGGLSKSPHVIRVFDAGYMEKIRSNYHVLQIVEGDTLDHLIGVAGSEHASILRPKSGRTSKDETDREFLKSLSASEGEAWRRNRNSPPFLAPPGLNHVMDLLTSTALWLEEVHSLGYAVNDLKNGNVMLSRRGQFKAIDLDSYSRIFSHLDKLPDFFFLAVSTLQLVTHGGAWNKKASSSEVRKLLSDREAMRGLLLESWPYGNLAEISRSRVTAEEVAGFFAGFIDESRSGVFASEPARFAAAIDRLIYLKRRISTEEMVLQ